MQRIIRKYFRCWEEAIRMLKKPEILLPFLLLALVETAVLASLTFFDHPPMSFIMVDIIKTVGGEKSLHFPVHFVLLPSVYETIILPIMAVIGFTLFGWGVFMMVDYYSGTGHRPGYYINLVFWNIPSFAAIGFVFVCLVIGLPFLLALTAGTIESVFWRSALLKLSWAVGISFEVLLIYSLFFAKLNPSSPVTAIRSSVNFSAKRFILTVMVVITVMIIHKPFVYLLSNPDAIILKFKPEIIFIILLVNIVVEIFTNYFIFSTTTYLATGKRWRQR